MQRMRRQKVVKTKKSTQTRTSNSRAPSSISLRSLSYTSLPSQTKKFTSLYVAPSKGVTVTQDVSSRRQEAVERIRFTSSIPYASPALKRMEHFITDMQFQLIDDMEKVEEEFPDASSLARGIDESPIQNIPLPKPTKPGKFQIDSAPRDPRTGMMGGGTSAVLQSGRVFEKAGVNTSVIGGMMPYDRLHHMCADHNHLKERLGSLTDEQKKHGCPFAVAGISLVFHPHNPHYPTVHSNYRMFQVDVGDNHLWWFGGGSDLTPTYVTPDDPMGKHFHGVFYDISKQTEEEIGKKPTFGSMYDYTKKWCDEYFYLPHRGETRGIGGIFYDDFDTKSTGYSQDELMKFVEQFGYGFRTSYFPILHMQREKTYTPEEKQFQQLRRGRYVEFNVMYDRGTKFGLQMPSSAHIRTEQILMSLPLTARYEYCHTPQPGSPEEVTLSILRSPINWM